MAIDDEFISRRKESLSAFLRRFVERSDWAYWTWHRTLQEVSGRALQGRTKTETVDSQGKRLQEPRFEAKHVPHLRAHPRTNFQDPRRDLNVNLADVKTIVRFEILRRRKRAQIYGECWRSKTLVQNLGRTRHHTTATRMGSWRKELEWNQTNPLSSAHAETLEREVSRWNGQESVANPRDDQWDGLESVSSW